MNPERRGTILAGVLFFLAVASPAAAGQFDDPRVILLRMTIASRDTAYEGRKVVIDFSRRAPAITRYEVVHRHAGQERKEFPDLGRVVVRKDGWLSSYDPRQAVVVRRRSPPSGEWEVLQRENLDLILRNYRVSLAEGAAILGRESVQVTFEPLVRGSRPSRKVWVDREKGLPLRGEVYGTDGNIYLITHFERLRFDPVLRAGVFEIRAPGARVVQADGDAGECTADAGRGVPRRIPEGFVLACVRLSGSKGGSFETQSLYTDGLSSLSLFQGAGERKPARRGARDGQFDVGGNPALVDDYGLLRVIRWNGDGRHYVLVGELTLEEMALVAASIGGRGDGR